MQINEIELLGLDIPPDTTEMIVADTDKILRSIPITESLKPTLLARTKVNYDYISNAFGTMPYVAIPEMLLTLLPNTAYEVKVFLAIETLGDIDIPFVLKITTSSAGWTGKMFGVPTQQILCNDSYTDTVIQNLDAEGTYITNGTYPITRASIEISGHIVTGSDVPSPFEIQCKNVALNPGDAIIRFITGTYMKLTPVTEQV